MLVSQIETQRQAQGRARPPILPPPSDSVLGPISMKGAE
jgi:TldD protein